jgi:hypothetical protein
MGGRTTFPVLNGRQYKSLNLDGSILDVSFGAKGSQYQGQKETMHKCERDVLSVKTGGWRINS